MKRTSIAVALAGLMVMPMVAQAQGGGGGGQGQRRMATAGTVTEITADSLTVQPRRMGRPGADQQQPAPVKFALNDKTLYAEVKVGKLADLKAQQYAVIMTDGADKPSARGIGAYTTAADEKEAGRVLRVAAQAVMMRVMMAGGGAGGGRGGRGNGGPGVAGNQAQIGVPLQGGPGGGQRPAMLRGQITAAGNGTVTIKTADKEIVVTTPENTVVLTAAAAKHDDIAKDNTVSIGQPEGAAEGDAKVADVVVKMPPMQRPGGAGAGGQGGRGNGNAAGRPAR